MNIRKSLFGLALVVGIAVNASAQNYKALNNTVTAGTVTAGTLSTFSTLTCAVSDYSNVGLQMSCVAASAATLPVTVYVYESLDSTTYETTPKWIFPIALNGTTPICLVTNIATPSVGVFKITMTNSSAVNVTGVNIKIYGKSPRVQARP